MNIHPPEREKVCINDTSDEVLTFKMHKELMQLNQ